MTLAGHPFDTVKIRLQVQRPGEEMYRGTFHCARMILKKEGFRNGLYAGVASPLFGQMFFRAGSFLTFHATVDKLSEFTEDSASAVAAAASDSKAHRYKTLLASGAITGALIASIETPIDLVKTKLQTTYIKGVWDPSYKPPFNNFRSCVGFLYERYGALGLYQGYASTLFRNVPANALFFPVNEIAKDNLMEFRGYSSESDLTFLERLACGACAGLSYWVTVCPLDCIKTQIMMTPLIDARAQNLTYINVVKNMYKEGGIARFYQGLIPLAMRAIPACGMMFATVDALRHWLGEL